jgi:diaminopimelate decarboxylase
VQNEMDSRFLDFVSEKYQELQNPFYVYDLAEIKGEIASYKSALAHFELESKVQCHFAMKTNHHPEVLKLFKSSKMGIDAVSIGEVQWALEQGFESQDVILSGVAKTKHEIELALKLKVNCINVESVPELIRIGQMASDRGLIANVALRMNPDIEVPTHPHISTGFRENKFGIDSAELLKVKSVVRTFSKSLNVKGLTIHIGSQILDLNPFGEAFEKLKHMAQVWESDMKSLDHLDLGGGLGVKYSKNEQDVNWSDYFKLVASHFKQSHYAIFIEPGRRFVAKSGFLVSQVQYVKRTAHKNFLIVDTGMNHLMRPALYESHHEMTLLQERGDKARPELFDVVGPICESTDVLGKERLFSDPREGDLLLISNCGAYGAVMQNDYNLRARAKEIIF